MAPAAGASANPDARFRAALAELVPEAAPMAHRELLEQLATAPLLGIRRFPYASNAVFVVELDAPSPDGARNLRAIYKPARGERRLWDFPHGTLHFRETATYEVDIALGFGLTPPTVLRDGPAGPGSMQLFVEALERSATRAQRIALSAQVPALAALDVLVNNADRKSSHLLVNTDGRLIGIDHGLTFLPYPRQRTVLLELGGALLPDDVAAPVRGLQADRRRRQALLSRLRRLLAPTEVNAFAARLRELAADPVYPVLDPWDGRPWEGW